MMFLHVRHDCCDSSYSTLTPEARSLVHLPRKLGRYQIAGTSQGTRQYFPPTIAALCSSSSDNCHLHVKCDWRTTAINFRLGNCLKLPTSRLMREQRVPDSRRRSRTMHARAIKFIFGRSGELGPTGRLDARYAIDHALPMTIPSRSCCY